MYKSFHYYMLNNFKPGSFVLEFGSGEGTKLLSNKFGMISIEHDIKFIGLCEKAYYIYAPIVNGWYDVDCIRTYIGFIDYQYVLVDGPTGKIGRHGLLNHLDLFNTDVPWLFDDTNREKERLIASDFSQLVNRPMCTFDCGDKKFTVI